MNYVDKDEKFRWALLGIAFTLVILFVALPKLIKGASNPKPQETTSSISTTQEATTHTTTTTEKTTEKTTKATTTKEPESTTESTTKETTSPPTTKPVTAYTPLAEDINKIIAKKSETFFKALMANLKKNLPEPETTTQATTKPTQPYVPPATQAPPTTQAPPKTTKPATTKPPTTTTTKPLEQTWTIIGLVKEVSGNNVGITQNGGKTVQHFSLRNGAVGIKPGQTITITGHKNQNGEVWYTH